MADAPPLAVGLVQRVRAAGLTVPVDSSALFLAALTALDPPDPSSLYWAARATLCRRPEDVESFDAAFAAWVHDGARAAAPTPVEVVVGVETGTTDGGAGDTGDAGDADVPTVVVRASATEVLRERDFAAYDAADHAAARTALRRLRLHAPRRRSRRTVPVRRPTSRLDLRRTVRAALRHGGEVVERPGRRPAERPRRIVLLCDVSGSMEPYARVIVRFLHAAVGAGSHVEAFALGTRLTRLTHDLRRRDPDRAVAAASRRVVDWSGGTRLGETLTEFNRTWGARGMARGAVVVVVSDGWDRGDAARLGAATERLARWAHRLVWVNPLKASPGYEPLAAGMAAALPFVDDFVTGHSLAALEELVAVVEAAA